MNPQKYWMLSFNKFPVLLVKRLSFICIFLNYGIGQCFVHILVGPLVIFPSCPVFSWNLCPSINVFVWACLSLGLPLFVRVIKSLTSMYYKTPYPVCSLSFKIAYNFLTFRIIYVIKSVFIIFLVISIFAAMPCLKCNSQTWYYLLGILD